MERDRAAQQVRETLQDSFNKERFVYFVKELLNKVDESKAFHAHGYVPEIFRNYVKTYERIGTYTDPEDKKIDILIVYLQKETNLARARTAQRNFVARYLNDRDEKDAGLIAFVSPDQEDWRFSFVKMEYRFEQTIKGNVKVKEEFTPARRYSFLVGKNENSHTAQSYLLPLLEDDSHNPTLKQIEEKFSIEKVTWEFFEKYQELFLWTKKILGEIIKKNPLIKDDFTRKEVDIVDFSKKLLGQIVFLYFLQKKGWFGVEKNKPWGTGPKNFLRQLFEKKHSDYHNFFNDILEPLFYEALAKERDKDFYSRFNCKIPFLNGGLFDPINDYDWVDTDICLSDELFSNTIKTKEGDVGTGILDVFDRYNFTVREDEPLEKEVAVDPEMLGKVFENLLAVKNRKSKGTYYTPREIVHYMCQESLINYLATECYCESASGGRGNPGVPTREEIETFIKYGEIAIEHEDRIAKTGRQTTTYSHKLPKSIRNNAKLIDEKLVSIRICDPACGSGAFLVGMMSEIVRARHSLTTFLSLRETSATKQSRGFYDFKSRAIRNCLYGVDIDPGAVEIAKLRLWLSLMVDEEDVRKIKPLPNLDYKIIQGNSLLEEYEGIKLIDERFFEKEENKDEIIKKLSDKQSELQSEYIDLHGKNQLSPIRKQQIETKLKEIARQIQSLQKDNGESAPQHSIFAVSEPRRKAEKILDLKKKFFEVSQKKAKDKLKQDIENLSWELIEATLKEQGKQNKIEEITRFRKENIKPFFLWKLHFAEIFQEKGGFDVVIANPPYIDSETMVKEQPVLRQKYSELYSTAKGNWDLYVPFLELGHTILANDGTASFITPNKWFAIGYGKEIRKKLIGNIYRVANCNSVKVFEAGNSPVVTIFGKNSQTKEVKIDKFDNNYSIGHSLNIKRRFLADNLGLALSDFLSIASNIRNQPKIISDYYVAENPCSVSEAYEIKKILKYLSSYKDSDRPYFRFVNTGTIDHFLSLWGKKNTTYLKSKYYNPIVNKLIFQKLFPRRYKQTIKPKLIISGMRHFESFFDEDGQYIAGKSTEILLEKNEVSLKVALGILNSRLISFYIKQVYSVLGIDGGINFTTDLIESLPIPELNTTDIQKPFIEIINNILAITKSSDYLENTAKKEKIREYKHQIDQMVYKLYNLTPGEIKIIEGENE